MQTRLIVYFLLLLLPLMSVSLYALHESEQILVRQMGDKTRAALSASMDYIDVIMQGVEDNSILISTDRQLNDILNVAGPEQASILEAVKLLNKITDIAAVNHYISDISVWHDRLGLVVSSSLKGARAVDLRGEEWYRQTVALNGAGLLVIPGETPERLADINYIVNRDNIVLTRSMGLNKSGQNPNLVSIAIHKKTLLDSIDHLLASAQTEISLYAADGRLIASTNPEGKPLPEPPTGDGFIAKRPGTQERVFTARAVSAKTKWSIVLVQPEALLYQDSQKIQAFTFVMIAISVLLAVLLAWLLHRNIASPLRSLSRGMKRIRKGDFDVRLSGGRKDEFGFLMESFNQMAQQQKHLVHDIYEQQIRMTKTELKYLQSQINPHFLYNTLDSIYWTAKHYDAEEISEMVVNLSRFFRLSLSRGKEVFTVEETIGHLQYYVRVQQLRLLEKIAVVYDVPEHTRHLYVLKLILQPLVENAILHGLEKKRSSGELRIGADIADGLLQLQIRDNGVGMTPERLAYVQAELARITEAVPLAKDEAMPDLFGLRNVKARLKLYYGELADLALDSVRHEGTTVTVRIPLDRCRESGGGNEP